MSTRLAHSSLVALMTSLSVLNGGSTLAAEAIDHSAHKAPAARSGAHSPAPMDHSAMGHGVMPMKAGQMDHSQMKHGQMKHAQNQDTAPAPDHSHMDHAQMNHSQMNHSQMNQGSANPPRTTSRTPLAVLTDADRQAAFPPLPGHAMHDNASNSFLLLDQFEYQNAEQGSTLAWDASGWVGGDINRLWFRSEGQRANGVTEDAELQLLYGHSISPWWDVVAGVRQDFKPQSAHTWAAFGVQGMPLYALEAEATAYVGEDGQTAARLAGEYDILLTNRLILQPTAEANFYGKNDAARGIGAGLSSAELGLRLRYEIVRQFAPYIGVSWSRAYGNTADWVRDEGGDTAEARFVAGIRMWF